MATKPEQDDKESDEKQNAHIQQQLQVANRTASEATHRSEIKEAQESHEREERSRRKAEQCKDELSILPTSTIPGHGIRLENEQAEK